MDILKKKFDTIRLELSGKVLTLVLHRPEVRNAFNDIMIFEISDFFRTVNHNHDHLRIIVITGESSSFCAGADLNWMKSMVDFTYEKNLADSKRLAEMFKLIDSCPLPVIARVNGSAVGGGVGLVAISDIAVAAESATFGLSEVKLGLAPAVISPYLVRRLGERYSRQYFLTGERISAARAGEIGLVNEVAPDHLLGKASDKYIEQLLTAGPNAIAICKELLAKGRHMNEPQLSEYMADVIARLRIGQEAQEGMKAFLEKRLPRWSAD